MKEAVFWVGIDVGATSFHAAVDFPSITGQQNEIAVARGNFKSLDDCFEMLFGISFRGVFGSYLCGQLPQTTEK